MAFSMGSIFVELTANTAQFLTGMDKAKFAAKQAGKDIEKGLGTVSSALSALGPQATAAGSVLEALGAKAAQAFTVAARNGQGLGTMMSGLALTGVTGLAAGMFALAEHASEVGAKIFEASEKTGIGASQMSGLMAIAKETGGDFDSLSTSLARAGANLEKGILNPGGQVGKVLAQVMGSAKNLADLGLKPMGDRIQSVLAHIFALNDTGERNLALSALLGRGWMQNVMALKLLGSEGYAPAIEQARKFGMFFDDNAAAQAKQFQGAMAALKSEISGVSIAVGQNLIPYMHEFVINMAGAIPALEAFGLRVMAIQLALTGVGLPIAVKMWHEANGKMAEANEQSNQLAISVSKLAAGERASAEDTAKLTGAVKAHHDVLADIIERERDQIGALDITGNKARELRLEYDRTTREIEKATAAGGDHAESLKAQALALELYKSKLAKMPAHIPSMPGAEGLGDSGIGANRMQPYQFATSTFSALTLDQLAKLPGAQDNVRLSEKAMRLETALSADGFKKLASAFPGLTEAEVAATASGQRLIEQLTRLDKVGGFSQQFTALKNSLITDGQDLGGKLSQVLGGSINGLEDQFAHLAVTGKANFKSLAQGIEEQILKGGMQKGMSVMLSGLHLPGMAGSKRDGNTPNSSIYVSLVNESGAIVGGIGSAVPQAGGVMKSISGSGLLSGLPSGLKGVMGSIGTALGSILKNLFGGGLAAGGAVTPDQLYMVGEQGPELFAPGIGGSIVPNGSFGGTHNYIDARGAQPGVEHLIVRALQGMQKQMGAQALASTYEYHMRGGTL